MFSCHDAKASGAPLYKQLIVKEMTARRGVSRIHTRGTKWHGTTAPRTYLSTVDLLR